MFHRASKLSKLKTDRRGETIVEVMFAIVILSIVVAAAYTLSNRAVRIGQASIERTEAVNMVESQTEALRGIALQRGEAWATLMSDSDGFNYVGSQHPDYSDEEACPADTGLTDAFYIDTEDLEDLSGSDIIVNGVKGESDPDTFYKVWIEGYQRSDTSYVDFHVRACWDRIGSDIPERSTSVLRLNMGSETSASSMIEPIMAIGAYYE